MYRKLWACMASILLLAGLGRTAAAAENLGSIRINLKTTEGEVALYSAAAPASGGYNLAEVFGGGFIKAEDAHSPALARWLAEMAQDGEHRILDADGSAEFSRLEQGLYLVCQTETGEGESAIAPFLVEIPYQGQWNIQANPKSDPENPRTGQSPQPFLGAAGMLLSAGALHLCLRRRKP